MKSLKKKFLQNLPAAPPPAELPRPPPPRPRGKACANFNKSVRNNDNIIIIYSTFTSCFYCFDMMGVYVIVVAKF